MTGRIIGLIIIVLAIAVSVAMVIVKKWEEMFVMLSVFITVLAIINLILRIFGVY